MEKLLRAMEDVRQRLPSLRRRGLNEASTRRILIDPILEALGWDVCDPDEVELEHATVDGRSVDYALKLNRRPVLLVEAKPVNDTLEDVKAVTQVVGYAANAGIVWCILTNGVKWRVYGSMEKCPAPDKLMFEVSLDPDEAEDMTVEDIARKMLRFSRDEIARGSLDALGERIFTDEKVRKALRRLMHDPPRTLINLVRKAVGQPDLSPQRLRESLARLASSPTADILAAVADDSREAISPRAPETPFTAKGRKKRGIYDEEHHLRGKSGEVVQLFRTLERFCLSLDPQNVWKRCRAKSINYGRGKRIFCSVHLQRSGVKVWLPLKYGEIGDPPDFARDVSAVGHWGVGDLELRISTPAELDAATVLLRRSFESVR